MRSNSKIYVAGHNGLVGSALIRQLTKSGYSNIITRTFFELDLRNQSDVNAFFAKEQPDYVFLAAAKVGGIYANNTYKAEFIYDNLAIATNVIHASYKYKVKKLLNLGSSCIYPKLAPQPLKEEYLLTGELEPTNEPYAIAKIVAIKLCQYYNEQYNTNFISVMPTNLYGPNDNFDLETAHVLPTLIRKFHLAKLLGQEDFEAIKKDFDAYKIGGKYLVPKSSSEIAHILESYGITKNHVMLWGTGAPYREFLYVDDLAQATVFLMQNYNHKDIGPFVNIGTGQDITIKNLAQLIQATVIFTGATTYDSSKPDGTPRKLLNVDRLKKLQWNHSIELKLGIKKLYEWYLSQQSQPSKKPSILFKQKGRSL
ncbi:GDP-L-fucose synthase [Candidatus Dependentiae bacterium]|nr:GDP-L-fucose synthase [Candidatus Dependentiae bacterium]